MARVLVEQQFTEPLTDDRYAAFSKRLDPCLEIRDGMWRRSSLAVDRLRMLCEFEAPDAEAVREAFRHVGNPVRARLDGECVRDRGLSPAAGEARRAPRPEVPGRRRAARDEPERRGDRRVERCALRQVRPLPRHPLRRRGSRATVTPRSPIAARRLARACSTSGAASGTSRPRSRAPSAEGARPGASSRASTGMLPGKRNEDSSRAR